MLSIPGRAFSYQHFDTEMYWDLTVDTFGKQNSRPTFSKEHLVNMLSMIKDMSMGEMWVARTSSGEVAAAEVTLRDSQTVHRWSAASSEEHAYSGVTSLPLSEIFTDMMDRNYTSINLMAGNIAHLSAFVASFNPNLVPYYGVELHKQKYKFLKGLKTIFARANGETLFPGSGGIIIPTWLHNPIPIIPGARGRTTAPTRAPDGRPRRSSASSRRTRP